MRSLDNGSAMYGTIATKLYSARRLVSRGALEHPRVIRLIDPHVTLCSYVLQAYLWLL